ncbi:unnamed protein product [Kuraishia capsulata CBS 1993]|uniref:Uncharacterized protein n=1 Tax=Kuraishia capsulata CBS 1993 TaxID=1382522 RepID=W6MIF5_9ASCO|nr:uncharacterized protein KUCA_T00000092001 [Kuraishia capsulata CBS 1993]CDK24132.1 unnamed protein product [Kuraishia capsulata CBS 1993]
MARRLNAKLLPPKRLVKSKAKSEIFHGKMKSKIERRRDQSEKLAKLRKSDWETINNEVIESREESQKFEIDSKTLTSSGYEVLEDNVEA